MIDFAVLVDAHPAEGGSVINEATLPTVGDVNPSNKTNTVETALEAAVVEAPPFFSPELGALVPPHLFFRSDAQFGGQPAAEGETVLAINETGLQVGRALVKSDGSWSIQVSPAQAKTVAFTIGQSARSRDFDVSSGQLTDVRLDLEGPLVRDTALWADGDATLGVDDGTDAPTGGPLPPLTTPPIPSCFDFNLVSLVCRDGGGNLIFRPEALPPPFSPPNVFATGIAQSATASGRSSLADANGASLHVPVSARPGRTTSRRSASRRRHRPSSSHRCD